MFSPKFSCTFLPNNLPAVREENFNNKALYFLDNRAFYKSCSFSSAERAPPYRSLIQRLRVYLSNLIMFIFLADFTFMCFLKSSFQKEISWSVYITGNNFSNESIGRSYTTFGNTLGLNK